jgi:hypothetical protein
MCPIGLNDIQPYAIFKNHDLSLSLSVDWWLWWFHVINFLPLFINQVKNVPCWGEWKMMSLRTRVKQRRALLLPMSDITDIRHPIFKGLTKKYKFLVSVLYTFLFLSCLNVNPLKPSFYYTYQTL